MRPPSSTEKADEIAKRRDLSTVLSQTLKSRKRSAAGPGPTRQFLSCVRVSRLAPDSRARHAYRATTSLFEPVLLHIGMDDVTLNFNSSFQRTEPYSLRLFCDRFYPRDWLSSQRDRQRLAILLYVFQHLNTLRLELGDQNRFHTEY